MNCFSGWKDLYPNARSYDTEILRGPVANQGFDPVGEGENTPNESWLFLTSSDATQYHRRGAFYGPNGKPPIERVYPTRPSPIRYRGQVYDAARVPLTWQVDHHGVGFKGELYLLSTGDLYVHHQSYGVENPTYPPGFLQCAIYSTRLEPLTFIPQVRIYVHDASGVLVFAQGPAAGGKAFVAISHPDGVNETTEGELIRENETRYRLEFSKTSTVYSVGVTEGSWVIVDEDSSSRPVVKPSVTALVLSLLLWLAPILVLAAIIAASLLVRP
jgi:hypothetical protein